MGRDEWTVVDRFGHTWRFHVDQHGPGGDPHLTREVVDTLSHSALLHSPQRGDRELEALFQMYMFLERAPVPHDAHGALVDAHGDEGRASIQLLRQALFRNAEIGRLRVERLARETRLHYELEAPSDELMKPDEVPTDWIAIELVDEDGEPLANVEYRIEDPSGDVRRGSTDAMGKARVEGLEPGKCKVSFPKLDGSEWRKSGKSSV